MRSLMKEFNFEVFFRKFGMYVILLLALLVSTILKPEVFPTLGNLVSILVQVSIVIILACGECVLILGGSTDLSAGSVVAMTGVYLVGVYVNTGSFLLAFLVMLAMGLGIGFVNGFFVSKFQLPPFIVTLGTQFLARGICYLYSDGMPISIKNPNFKVVGQGNFLGIPYTILIAAAIVLVTWVLVNRTRFGRYVYAVGGNAEAAKASGVNVDSIIIRSYMYMGALAGMTGWLLMSRLNVGQPSAAVNYEFDAIIGVILGGTSFSGGVGTVGGAVVGCIIMGVLSNLLNLVNVPPNWQYVARGLIILIAVTLDATAKKAGAKRKI